MRNFVCVPVWFSFAFMRETQRRKMYINNYCDADYRYYFNKINLTLIFAYKPTAIQTLSRDYVA